MNVKEKLQALLTASNTTTGETDTTLTDAVRSLIDGYGGGGAEEVYSSDWSGAVYTKNFVMPDRESANTDKTKLSYENSLNMETLYVGRNYLLGGNLFKGCTALTFAKVCSNTGSEMFWNCKALTTCVISEGVQNIATWTFDACSALQTVVVLGNRVADLSNVNSFGGSGIKQSGGTGKIYVPFALLNDYKSATNWASFASNILAIEDNLDVVGDYL